MLLDNFEERNWAEINAGYLNRSHEDILMTGGVEVSYTTVARWPGRQGGAVAYPSPQWQFFRGTKV